MQREPFFTRFALDELMPFAEKFPLQYVQGARNFHLAYRHFIQHKPTSKLVILVNGRAESILKWTEIAYDFYQQGYDVLAFDHRGQGYSDRLLPDPEKGHIDEFRFYMEDMQTIIRQVENQYDYEQQFIVAHSMGALISSYYLAHYDHHITKAVFCSPFFGVPLKRPILDKIIISFMLLFGQGSRYVFGKEGFHPANLLDNGLSFCKTRMKWHNRINRNHPDIHLGGPTFRWVHLNINAIAKLPHILPKIETPILVLHPEKDPIVDNKNLENLTALLRNGEKQMISRTKHELLFERDEKRTAILQKIFAFLGEK